MSFLDKMKDKAEDLKKAATEKASEAKAFAQDASTNITSKAKQKAEDTAEKLKTSPAPTDDVTLQFQRASEASQVLCKSIQDLAKQAKALSDQVKQLEKCIPENSKQAAQDGTQDIA